MSRRALGTRIQARMDHCIDRAKQASARHHHADVLRWWDAADCLFDYGYRRGLL